MASLVIHKGANQGPQVVSLESDKSDKFILGRDPKCCQIVIPGNAVSRLHAQILRLQGRFFIEDLNSRNKTFVNEQQVTSRRVLKDNDQVKICDCVCTFRDPAKPLPPDLRPEEPEPPEDTDPPSAIEAAISHLSSQTLLETQPAEKLKAMLDISSNLSRTLQIDALLPKIADSLFHLFRQADRCFIIQRDPGSPKLIIKALKTRRNLDETDARFSRRIVNQCMETVQAFLSDDASTDNRFNNSQSIAEFRIRSVMCAPLVAQDGKDAKAFGVIQLDTQDRHKKFTQDDLSLLMGVANQASVALENAKLHHDLVSRERVQREMQLARQVQMSFLPHRLPQIPGYEFFAKYEPALEVSGDCYDFIPLRQQRLAILLGDVAGKGVSAALLMAKISSEARFCLLTEEDPAAAITKLNGLLHEAGLTERFMTMAVAVLDSSRHVLTLVNAGHPSPLLYRGATGTLEEATTAEMTGFPIGVEEGCVYSSCQAQLNPGDSLVIFSDGISESMNVNEDLLEFKGIIAALKGGPFSPTVLGERLVKAVKQHAGARAQNDDITMVIFGRSPQ